MIFVQETKDQNQILDLVLMLHLLLTSRMQETGVHAKKIFKITDPAEK